ncbi:hypothetical protein PAXINDRAFT_172673 [Paxillus involutus ATCC 200175]|uniref:Uncharacterized protein n=1 Tax=Paxillus involutus ATCC 200175 TaxID=664439 RepID=A0A0C9TMJ0_PAXIN|nr:hypothetical protein PAXINDRAFT_172673 [Paxillus involutus ATCC 200175]
MTYLQPHSLHVCRLCFVSLGMVIVKPLVASWVQIIAWSFVVTSLLMTPHRFVTRSLSAGMDIRGRARWSWSTVRFFWLSGVVDVTVVAEGGGRACVRDLLCNLDETLSGQVLGQLERDDTPGGGEY